MSANVFLHAYVHELELETVSDDIITDDPPVDEAEPEPPDTFLTNQAKGSRPTSLPPGDIGQILTRSLKHSAKPTHVEYKVSYHKVSSGQSLSLIDRCTYHI
jgi:hypothetical protein